MGIRSIKNSDNSALNLQSTESKIRDADISKEMLKYSKQSILNQSSQAMLSQVKEMNNSILNLVAKWK